MFFSGNKGAMLFESKKPNFVLIEQDFNFFSCNFWKIWCFRHKSFNINWVAVYTVTLKKMSLLYFCCWLFKANIPLFWRKIMNLQETHFVVPLCVRIYKVTIDNLSDMHFDFSNKWKKLHNSWEGLCPVKLKCLFKQNSYFYKSGISTK